MRAGHILPDLPFASEFCLKPRTILKSIQLGAYASPGFPLVANNFKSNSSIEKSLIRVKSDHIAETPSRIIQ